MRINSELCLSKHMVILYILFIYLFLVLRYVHYSVAYHVTYMNIPYFNLIYSIGTRIITYGGVTVVCMSDKMAIKIVWSIYRNWIGCRLWIIFFVSGVS